MNKTKAVSSHISSIYYVIGAVYDSTSDFLDIDPLIDKEPIHSYPIAW